MTVDGSAVRRAAALMILASALVAVTTLLAKALGRGIGTEGDGAAPMHALMIGAGRYVFAFIPLAAIGLWKRPSFKGTRLDLHFGRTLMGWGGGTSLFAASALMPLATATAISFLSPMIAMVLAILFLSERVGPWRWAAAGISLAGALILIRPGSEAFQPAALIALAAALMMGTETIFIKRLSGREPLLRILIVNNAMGTVLAVSAALFVWTSPTPLQWLMMAGVGVVMVTAQACFVSAMRLADASYVMPFFYATLVFAALYDAAIFREWPDALGFVGAAIVVAGAVILAWREARARKPITPPRPSVGIATASDPDAKNENAGDAQTHPRRQ